jgi:S1-C subfamily serine protease
MSEMVPESTQQPAAGAPEAPPIAPPPMPDTAWFPPPPPPPPTLTPGPSHRWRWIVAAVVTWAIIAGAGGVAIGFTLARALATTHPSQAQLQTTVPTPASSQAPIQAATPAPTTGQIDAAAIASKVTPGIVDIYTTLTVGQAAGTGMIITSSGEVLTNNHVVDGSTTIEVTISGRSGSYTAHVVGVDPSADVAVIQIEGVSGLPTVTFASSSGVKVGDQVVALGNALGQGQTSVTQGSVVALDQTITASEGGNKTETLTGMIQSDATISPGDSGGALVNSAAQVIGMITAGEASGPQASTSAVNYSVPSDTALSIVNQIRSGQATSDIIYGQVGYMGVSVQDFTASDAAQLGINASQGAYIRSVEAGSPAAAAGIPAGSVITAIAGASVTSGATLGTVLHVHKPGEHVAVTWVDSKGSHTSNVTLGAINI